MIQHDRADYDPWKDLATRPELTVGIREIYRADSYLFTDKRAIILGAHLTEVEQRESLTHMLAHVDLGHQFIPRNRPRRSLYIRVREQAAVAVTVSRLISLPALRNALRNNTSAEGTALELGVSVGSLRARYEMMTAVEQEAFQRHGFNIEWPDWDNLPPHTCGLLDLAVERAYRDAQRAADQANTERQRLTSSQMWKVLALTA